ncbi:MAG: hypothetical protein ACOX3H_02490 [Saccharofermentanales bacterium]|jgi:hypothetical protein
MKNIQIKLNTEDYKAFISRYETSTTKTYRDFLFELLNIYDHKKGIAMENKFMPQKSEKEKFDYGQYMKNERDIYNDLVDTGIKNISEGESLKNLLITMQNLPSLSINNLIALNTQKARVSEIKTFNEWSKENVLINKGEKSLRMLKYDGEYTKKDGSKGNSYSVIRVFDITQTNKESKKINNKVDIGEEQLTNALLVMLEPVKIQIKHNEAAENVLRYSPEQKAIIVENANADFPTLHKELIKQAYNLNYPTNEKKQMLINETSLFINLSVLGLDAEYPSQVENYLIGKDPEEIRSFLDDVRNMNNMFMEGLDQCHQYALSNKNDSKENLLDEYSEMER